MITLFYGFGNSGLGEGEANLIYSVRTKVTGWITLTYGITALMRAVYFVKLAC
jgi:hypothetical protein